MIQIENGPVVDFQTAFGFIYMDANERTAADEKECETESHAEEAGEHIDPRTVDAPFDYTAEFLIEATNQDLINVNAKIAAFNAAVREIVPDSDIKRKKEITFYNLYNRVKIVGYPELIAVPKDVFHARNIKYMDYARVELKIRVNDPKKCDFSMFLGDGNNMLRSTLDWQFPWETHRKLYLGDKFKDFVVAYLANSGLQGSEYMDMVQQDVSFEPGGVYTLSFWASGSRVRTYCYPDLSSVIITTNGSAKPGSFVNDTYNSYDLRARWQRFFVTFKVGENYDRTDGKVLFRLLPGDAANIAGVKLETGDVMTAWSASPNDSETGNILMAMGTLSGGSISELSCSYGTNA